LGAKLLGAGEGGFMLVAAEPEVQGEVEGVLRGLLRVPFEFEVQGSQIVYYSDA